jgi:tetratricopeptide (TPR) repeat protein
MGDVQRNLEAALSIFTAVGFDVGVAMCDAIRADLLLREGNIWAAKVLYEKCLQSPCGNHPAIFPYCLAKLSEITCGDVALNRMPITWPIVLFVYSLKSKQKPGIYKALQYIGDIFLAQDEEDTAIILFTLALEGFTDMDVHRSRAECMLRLGDICQKHKNLFEAIDYWTTARPLFNRSSQMKQVGNIDKRLASMDDDVLEQYHSSVKTKYTL